MKKYIFGLLFIFCMLLSLQSCDIDNNTNIYPGVYPYTYGYYWQPNQTDDNGNYVIGGYVAGAPQTRAVAIIPEDIISEYSEFNLFAWTNDSVVMPSYHGVFNQNTWGYREITKYFDNDVNEYNFIGIIPYDDSRTIKSDNTIDVQLEDFTTEGVDPNQEKYNKEFIVATTTVDKSHYPQGATLQFAHQNSIVRIKFETNEGNNLEIIDYTPYTPGTPAKDAYDENIEVITYSMEGKPFPCLGPLNLSNIITDEDIDYINSKYSTTEWKGFYSSKVIISGDFDKNMWDYLLIKHPELSSTNIEEWATYVNDPNTKLIHVSKDGKNSVNNDSYRAWFINIKNITLTESITTETIHHEAVPGTPESGIKGIVVLPATSETQDGKDASPYTRKTFPNKVTANVSLDGVLYTETSTVDDMRFIKPGIVSTSGTYSPTNWYTFPIEHADNFGFTIKFSYILNGTTKYDARVYVPKADCNWQPGKWYDYVIKVNSTNHGHNNLNDEDADDPKIEDVYPIIVNTSIDEYSHAETHEYEL